MTELGLTSDRSRVESGFGAPFELALLSVVAERAGEPCVLPFSAWNAGVAEPVFTVRAADAADRDWLQALEHRAFVYHRLSRRSFGRFVASSTATLLVAEAQGVGVGYALVLFRSASSLARLYSLAVHPARTRRGVGSLLMQEAEAAARERGAMTLRLEVHEANSCTMRLYRKRGYTEFGYRPNYYADGGGALRMQKPL